MCTNAHDKEAYGLEIKILRGESRDGSVCVGQRARADPRAGAEARRAQGVGVVGVVAWLRRWVH